MSQQPNQVVFRQSWPDFCRVLAIFGVIIIHACGSKLYQYGKIAEREWLWVNFLDSLVRCSVPLFVMLSGALLLNRGSAIATPFQLAKRIKKILIPLIVWGTGYLLYVSHFTHEPIIWWSMLVRLPMYHLWFGYMIIGLYFLLPIFQAVFNAIINRRELQFYLLIIWICLTCVPIYWPVPLVDLMQQTSLLGFGGYFILGGVLATCSAERIYAPLWAGIYLLGVAITFFLTEYFSKRANILVETAYQYFSLNVFVASIAAFVVIFKIRIEGHFASILQWMSDKTFLIFFMHVFVLERVEQSVASVNLGMPTMWTLLSISIITFAVCLMISACLRVIPGSKVFLG